MEAPKILGPGFLVREMLKRGIRCYSDSFPIFKWCLQGKHDEEWTEEWKDLAGTLIEAIEGFTWYLEAGVIGKHSKHDWLECDICGSIQMRPAKDGAPKANRKCDMMPRCKGKMRRFDTGLFVVKIPRKKRKPKTDESI